MAIVLADPPKGSTNEDGSNSFQVYPVRGLSEIGDVVGVTVRTPEIIRVDDAVREFAEAFGRGDPPPKLLLAAKGDFGTGKTHLMVYAQAVLASALEERCDRERKVGPRAYDPVAAMAVSIEAPIEEWYESELGPTLIEVGRPRELVRELLVRVAIEVAQSDPDPEVQKLADLFRESRHELYQTFREPGAFDISKVDTLFSAEIAKACPRTSRSFRRAIEALRWEETAEYAEDWLAGHDLNSTDMARIGVRLEGDRQTRAANAICAIASLSSRLARPFCLYIDEFEHLTRFDRRNGSKRNITWVKRLVESLARRGAMVFISGHWEAWDQQGDFLDRFVGGRPIQLVRLTAEDVMDVVTVRAGKGAWPGFTPDSARSVTEATSGNIRRIITVLYDLWSSSGGPSVVVTDEAVRLAAQRRLQSGTEIGIIPAIEKAILAEGAILRRGERFGKSGISVELSAWHETELRLMVHVVYARDELALIAQSEEFARLVKEVRQGHPKARGLVVTLGAVVEKHILTLDAAFPETDLVNGENPETVQQLPVLVHRALVAPTAPVEAAAPQALKDLERVRDAILDQAKGQIARGQEVLGTDSRSEAVRAALNPDPTEVAQATETQRRNHIYGTIMAELSYGVAAEFLTSLFRRPSPILLMLLGPACFFIVNWFIEYQVYVGKFQPVELFGPLMQLMVRASEMLGFGIVLVGFYLAVRLYLDLIEFRRYRKRAITNVYEDGAPPDFIFKVNAEMADTVAALGPHQARIGFLQNVDRRP